MNYRKIYEHLVKKCRKRDVNKGEYYENHHILPKCLGGSNSKENIVKLTAREHYISHWLLYKMSSNQNEREKMGRAWMYMCYGNQLQNKKFTSKEYERARKHHAQNMRKRWEKDNPAFQRDIKGVNNPNYGNNWNIEQKKRMSDTKKKMWSNINSVYNSKEYRRKRSVAISGKKNGMYGKIHTRDTKRKISSANKGKLKSSKNHKSRIIKLISPSGKEYTTFGNLEEFCRNNNLTSSAIIMVCKGSRKHHKNWMAEYIDNK